MVLFLDPSRRVHGDKVVSIQDSEPEPFEFWEQISTSMDQLILKASPMAHIDEMLNKEYPPESIHAVSVNNELKELLYNYRYISDRLSKQDKSQIRYHAVDIKKNEIVKQGLDNFTILVDEDGIAPVNIPFVDADHLTKFSSISFIDDKGFSNGVKSYLYDPIVGAKKLGCMDHLGAGFDFYKLNKHTHL